MNEGEGEGSGGPSTYIVDAEISVILIKERKFCGWKFIIYTLAQHC